MSIRVSLRGMLKLIRIDTLRRIHNDGFVAGRHYGHGGVPLGKAHCLA